MFDFQKLAEKLFNASGNSFVLAVSEEILFKLSSAKRTENELSVEVFKYVNYIGMSNLLNLVENLLVSLLGNCSFARITKSPL